MLPKKNRANRKDLDKVFKKALFLASPNLTFRYLKDKDVKISFIVNKTVSKRAVKRNSLRRKGYDMVQKSLILLPFPVLGVFLLKKDNIDNLEHEIKDIFNKIH